MSKTLKGTPRQLVLCLQVHQPRRLKTSEDQAGFDDALNQHLFEQVANAHYLPTNRLLLRLLEQHPQLRITFSISGLALEQMEQYHPELLQSFQALTRTGSVDIVAEPYYHSMAFLMESEEFEIQVLEHTEKIVEHFGIHPWVFRNTALFYNDDIGRRVSMMGFQGVLTEGSLSNSRGSHIHQLYEHRDGNGLKILLRNNSLSDDIAFRVAEPQWNITAEKFLGWLEQMPEDERLVVLSMNYETFGGSGTSDTCHFLEHLLLLLSMQNEYEMATPASLVQTNRQSKILSVPDYISITGCTLSDWFGNDHQREAFAALVTLEPALKHKNDPTLLKMWRCLQSVDHFYYMSEKVHGAQHLSPYLSPEEAYSNFMAMIRDITRRIDEPTLPDDMEKRNDALESERRNLHDPVWAMSIDPRQNYPQN